MLYVGQPSVVEPMSLEEEIHAPEDVKRTRMAKITMDSDLKWLIKYAEQLRREVPRIPEEDDKRHADMVVRLQELVREAYLATNKACFYDGI